ncbi:glutamate-rich protein 1 isoform X2 [Silurus meridionalis]|uniref:glutamate-rich protein 1 isoform X2 n=1 Tax=Silurus meridionalis TaxID=175797 RepID=UPI001EEC97AC|nr:glutamate-rich protein 1 isoform X2 [Silurus meridionalis]
MSSLSVFQAKVLQRLYPAALKVVEKALETPAQHPQAATSGIGVQPKPSKVTDHVETPAVSGRKLYTVLSPPKDYLPASEDEWRSPTDAQSVNNVDELPGSEEHSATEDDQQAIKRRKRRRKRKAATPSGGNAHNVAADDDDEAKDAEEGNKGNTEGSECLSKNKRRKMKKKRHKERLLALGLVPRSTALEFTYKQSEEKEVEDEVEEKEVEEVLDFLRSTRDLYLSDRSYSTGDLSGFLNATESLFTHLSNGTSPPAVVSLLCRFRSLLRQSDVETLHSVLQEFTHTSTLPKDETEVIHTLFQYWMTEVLPMQTENKT